MFRGITLGAFGAVSQAVNPPLDQLSFLRQQPPVRPSFGDAPCTRWHQHPPEEFAASGTLAKSQSRSQSQLEAAVEVLDPEVLTIGFARRFATYKRAALILRDPDRLTRILNKADRPVQINFAGKAHSRVGTNPSFKLIGSPSTVQMPIRRVGYAQSGPLSSHRTARVPIARSASHSSRSARPHTALLV